MSRSDKNDLASPLDETTRGLLDVLRTGPVGVSSPTEIASARERMLPWLEERIATVPADRTQRRNQRRRKWVGSMLTVAAAAVLLLAFRSTLATWVSKPSLPDRVSRPLPAAEKRTEGFATLISGKVSNGPLEVLAGSRLGLSSRVSTKREQQASLVVKDGYRLDLGPSTQVSLAPPRRVERGTATRLNLHDGFVRLSVAPRPPGSSLSVVTSDATVTVVGTVFSVETSSDRGTCVRVQEGRVRVSSKDGFRVLGDGEKWGCVRPQESSSKPEVERGARENSSPRASKAPAPATGDENKQRAPTTTLQRENQLFSSALVAERKGDPKGARRAYRLLLEKYPNTAFRLDALAGLKRLDAATHAQGE